MQSSMISPDRLLESRESPKQSLLRQHLKSRLGGIFGHKPLPLLDPVGPALHTELVKTQVGFPIPKKHFGAI